MSLYNLTLKSPTQQLLIKSIKQNELPHTLIFYGPQYAGKLTCAYNIAKTLNCEKQIYDFCNKCTNCKKINSFSHPDITILNSYIQNNKINSICNLLITNNNTKILKNALFYFNELAHSFIQNQYIANAKPKPDTITQIENAKLFLANYKNNNKNNFENKINSIKKLSDKIYNELNQELLHIENIRNLIKHIYIKPIEAKNKITIINGAENMNIESANTLLKTIEEPPPHNNIILITRNIDKIIHTIRSRANAIYFPPINKETIPNILKTKLNINKKFVKENNSIWDYINKKNNTQFTINNFFTTIAPNYQKGNYIFTFTDKLIENKLIKNFLKELSDFLRQANICKYNINTEIQQKNPFYSLKAQDIDNIYNKIQEISYNLENFNTITALSINSLLITLAKQYNKLTNIEN